MKIYKKTNNLVLVKNVFPDNVCNKLYVLFKKDKSWKLINQKRNNHYKHVFSSSSKIMPDRNEKYYAKFYKSLNLASNAYINQNIDKFIFPILKKLKIQFKKKDLRCHKFKSKNFLRSHFDHYNSSYAININLNKKWKADWGGLLCVFNGKNFDKLETLGPEWNSVNILYSKRNQKKSPHFVTSVESYARESRYSITIFLS